MVGWPNHASEAAQIKWIKWFDTSQTVLPDGELKLGIKTEMLEWLTLHET